MVNKQKKDQASAELFWLAEATALLRMYRAAHGCEPISVEAVQEWAKCQPFIEPIEPTAADYEEVSRTRPELVALAEMQRMMAETEWVALFTFTDQDAGLSYEAGGVYSHEPPHCDFAQRSRELRRDERTVLCPRCGRRFAGTFERTAEEHRDRHFDGDEDIPSICQRMPTRRPKLVKS